MRLLENAAACQNAWGFTWWCSHDIDPAMKEFLSLEYTLGVFDQQNRVKPLGPTLSSLADEWRKNPPAVISRSVALVIPEKGLSKKGRCGRLERREIIYGPGSVTGCERQSCWRAVPGTRLISRPEGSKS